MPLSSLSKIVRISPYLLLAAAIAACTQSPPPAAPVVPLTPTFSTISPAEMDRTIAAIRTEGLTHSQVMKTLDYLCNAIGPRLTGSPQLKTANEWTRQTLASWGLENAHLEAWGPFGKGWTLKRFSLEVVSPLDIPLKAFPKAWSPGFDKPFQAEVVYLEAAQESDLTKYHGQLKDKIVLISVPRTIQPSFTPLARRYEDKDLAVATTFPAGMPLPPGGISALPRTQTTTGSGTVTSPAALAPTTQAAAGARGVPPFTQRILTFVAKEGAAVVLDSSPSGDGGVTLVSGASVPAGLAPATEHPSIYSLDAPKGIPAQVTLAIEDYNRLVRMLKLGQHLTMNVDLQVEFQTADPMAYNTIAEIPGSDLKDEVVMLGGHMDSWASGTGATDNGAGVASAMEAVRILKALNLKPRRTIRVALWSGEEQGLLGSKAYVAQHFGSRAVSPDPQKPQAGALTKGPDYEKLSVYFNLDNGSGKIRGVFGQGDVAAGLLFNDWLKPFHDLGAATVTMANTGSTDHIAFDTIGLPGFQFIQDPLDYGSRTHHTNADVFDRAQADDLRQASTIIAAFVWEAANMDQRFPRKPLPQVAPGK